MVVAVISGYLMLLVVLLVLLALFVAVLPLAVLVLLTLLLLYTAGRRASVMRVDRPRSPLYHGM